MGQRQLAAPSCPRCKQPLIDPKGLGWCKACGYCRSLQEGEKKAAEAAEAAEEEAKPGALTATTSVVSQSPRWIWFTLIGIALIAGATFAGGHFLVLKPLERALLTTVQIAAGILLLFVGQFLGLLRIAPTDSNMTFWDAIIPFRLYSLVFKNLPSTQLTVYCGAWGLTAIISAAVFVGGLEHWMTYLPKSGNQAQKTATKWEP